MLLPSQTDPSYKLFICRADIYIAKESSSSQAQIKHACHSSSHWRRNSELAKRFAEAIPEDELSVHMLNHSFIKKLILICRLRVFKVTFSEIRLVPDSALKKSPCGSFKSVKLGKNSRKRRLRFYSHFVTFFLSDDLFWTA